MKDGERRQIRPKHGSQKNLPFTVIAFREDADTPYVIINFPAHNDIPEYKVMLTDSDASHLANMINKALSILPTSK